MRMSLESETGSYRYYNCITWDAMLRMAKAYGWKPAGTEAPSDCAQGEWYGGYGSNDSQCVTAADAGSLAEALDLMLLDPDTDIVSNVEFPERHRLPGLADKAGLRDFADFCREGSFWID
jgi:hypothetical protein